MPKAKAAPPKRKPAKSTVRLYCSLQSYLRYDTYCKRLSLLLSSFPTPLLLSLPETLPETLSHTRAHSIRVCGSGQGVPSYWNSKLFLHDFWRLASALSVPPSFPSCFHPLLMQSCPLHAVLSDLPDSACLVLPSCPTYPTLRVSRCRPVPSTLLCVPCVADRSSVPHVDIITLQPRTVVSGFHTNVHSLA